jgi:hypothetical protein
MPIVILRLVGRHFNDGVRSASQYGTIAIEVYGYTDTAAAVVSGHFDTTPKEWTVRTRRNGCGSWWH